MKKPIWRGESPKKGGLGYFRFKGGGLGKKGGVFLRG